MEKAEPLRKHTIISPKEADQYRYDMLAEIAALPTQGEVELTEEMLDTNFWPEMDAASRGASNGNTCPTLRDYLVILQDPPGKMTSVSDVETYYYVSLRFGFRPNVSEKANLLGTAVVRDETYSDNDLDIGFIDDLIKEHFDKPLDFQKIGLRQPTIEKFEAAGIMTVGDFIMHASIAGRGRDGHDRTGVDRVRLRPGSRAPQAASSER